MNDLRKDIQLKEKCMDYHNKWHLVRSFLSVAKSKWIGKIHYLSKDIRQSGKDYSIAWFLLQIYSEEAMDTSHCKFDSGKEIGKAVDKCWSNILLLVPLQMKEEMNNLESKIDLDKDTQQSENKDSSNIYLLIVFQIEEEVDRNPGK